MKMKLPCALRVAILICQSLPLYGVLIWNEGSWNSNDTAWLNEGNPARFATGDAVEFNDTAVSTTVSITETVQPASMQVSGQGFVFTGSGSVGGAGALNLASGASLSIENANTFSGGTSIASGAALTIGQFNSVSTVNSNERSLGVISGGGNLNIALADASTRASISGDSLASFTGAISVQRGTIGLGRGVGHGGAGAVANLGAARVNVSGSASFITTLGGGSRALITGRSFNSDVYTQNGATIGNRDGHVNWSGNIYLNTQNSTAETPQFDDGGTTQMSIYYGKNVVWDGEVMGEGKLQISAGVVDSGSDHRLVLTNSGNTFSGTYEVNGEFLSTLALAASTAAANASVQLDSANARLALMGTSASVIALNGVAGLVFAEGSAPCTLTVGSGHYSGSIQDSVGSVEGLRLGINKVGSGALQLSGVGCTYTGPTSVTDGSLVFDGDVSLSSVTMGSSSARLSTTGGLTLRSDASLAIQVGASASIEVAGALSTSDLAHSVTVSGYEDLAPGAYDLMRWGMASAVDMQDFMAGSFNNTADYIYSLRVQGNALQLVVGDMGSVPWLWSGDSATWADDSAAQWSNTTGSGPAGRQVTFSVRNAGTVTIDRVTPAGISVNGGAYTFVAASPSSGGIVSSGILSVSGDSTLLQLNLANTSLSGTVMLLGGVLETGNADALGSASLYFNGGTLRYGSGVTTDVSPQIHSDSASAIKVDTNGNTVAWVDADGVRQVLSSGIEKLGLGTLSLTWNAANEMWGGDVSVQGGTLSISKTGTQGTLAGRISGSGTLLLNAPSSLMNINGDNSGFTGTIVLQGDGQSNTGSVCFANGNAMGGADTLVQISGQRFWFANSTTTAASMDIVAGSTTYFDGSSGRSYTFTGNISGGGDLIVKPSCNMTMSGDISQFTGSFSHPGASAVTWLLGGEGVSGSGTVQANLDSSGGSITYAFMYSAPTTMSGVVSGAAQLRQLGAGTLTLTGQNTSTGAMTIDDGCSVQLGSAASASSWSGTAQLGTGQLTLVNGRLNRALSTVEGSLVADVAAAATVDMGGTRAELLQSIRIAAGGQLMGLSGDVNVGAASVIDSMELTLGPANVGAAASLASGEQFMLGIENGNLVIHDATNLTLDMETVKSILQGKRQAVYLHVADADLELMNGLTAADLFDNSATTPEALGLVVLGVQGGNIVLEGAVREVYMVMQDGDYDTVTDYTRLQPYLATYVDAGYTLALNLPGDNTQVAWVNNLMGSGNMSVSNTAESSGVVRVLLNNEFLGDLSGVLTPGQEGYINAANSEILGNVSAGRGVQLVKTGSGTLSIGGALTADWLEIDEGILRLTGGGSMVNTLHGSGAIALEGILEIFGNALAFDGDITGDGELIVNGMARGTASVGSLSGSGELRAAGSSFVVRNTRDSDFSGSLVGGEGQGVLSLKKGEGRTRLNVVKATKDWSISNAGRLELNQTTTGGDNAVLTLNELALLDGSSTTVIFNANKETQVFSLSSVLVEDGATLTLQSTGELPVELSADGTVLLGTAESGNLGSDGRVPLNLAPGAAFRNIESAWLSLENGMLVLHAIERNENLYAALVQSGNAMTGAQLVWQLPNAVLQVSPDLSAVASVMDEWVSSGNAAAADKLMAAVAGAGAAALGNAVQNDVQRQLRAIRNRTTHMGLDPRLEYANLPLFNAWINAEGDRRKRDTDGSGAGYTLSSWGGTVGMDIDFSTEVTAGLAITAMYGDFDASSADSAHGDVDTYYLTLFGRYVHHRWTHTLVCSLGWADAELHRRVDYGRGAYSTEGDTHGLTFGFLYELGYVIPLGEDNDSCIQPIVNVNYMHTDLNAYSENGSDAALRIGRQSMNTVSFGLGARAQTYALENMYNRSCLLEVRMLLKMDAGDRRSSCAVSLLADASRGGRIGAAEQGVVGMEMGAGITIPMGESAGNLFLDAAFEVRADESAVNGTVGYRLNF